MTCNQLTIALETSAWKSRTDVSTDVRTDISRDVRTDLVREVRAELSGDVCTDSSQTVGCLWIGAWTFLEQLGMSIEIGLLPKP